jgi:hypothetical protein
LNRNSRDTLALVLKQKALAMTTRAGLPYEQAHEIAGTVLNELVPFPFLSDDRERLEKLLGTKDLGFLEAGMNLAARFPHGYEKEDEAARRAAGESIASVCSAIANLGSAIEKLSGGSQIEIAAALQPILGDLNWKHGPGLGMNPTAASKTQALFWWLGFTLDVKILRKQFGNEKVDHRGPPGGKRRRRPPLQGRIYIAECLAAILKRQGRRPSVTRTGPFVRAIKLCLKYTGLNENQVQHIAEHVARSYLNSR